MNRFVGTAVVGLGCVALVTANPPAAYQPAAAGYAVPLYTAVYSPAAQQDGDLAAAVRELAAEVRALREEVARLRGPGGGPAAQTSPKPDGLAVAVRSCSACHSPAAATERGGGLVLFDSAGALAPLSPRDRQRAVNRVRSGSMPPPPAKVADGERAVLAEFFQKK